MKIQADVYLTACGYPPMPKKYEFSGWKTEPITNKQKTMLERYGVAYSRVKYKGQASMIIDLIFKRNEEGLATPKQIQVLLKNGYSFGKVKRLTVKGASKIISEFLYTED